MPSRAAKATPWVLYPADSAGIGPRAAVDPDAGQSPDPDTDPATCPQQPFLNYGTLDYLVFCFLKDHLSLEEFAKVNDWRFKDRLSRIARHLQEVKCPAEQQNEFAQLVRRLEPIRELRNHIAHGHMYFRIDEETRRPTVTVFRAKDLDTGWMPDAKHVEFPELLGGLTTLNELIESFQSLAGLKLS